MAATAVDIKLKRARRIARDIQRSASEIRKLVDDDLPPSRSGVSVNAAMEATYNLAGFSISVLDRIDSELVEKAKRAGP